MYHGGGSRNMDLYIECLKKMKENAFLPKFGNWLVRVICQGSPMVL